jgi:hypothetical protein
LDDDRSDEESAQPVETRTSEGLQPEGGIRKRRANIVDDLIVRKRATYTELRDDSFRERNRLRAKVVKGGDFALVATIKPVEEFLRKERCDIAEQVLDRLIFDDGVLNSNGTLENANTLRVLIEDSLNILSRP